MIIRSVFAVLRRVKFDSKPVARGAKARVTLTVLIAAAGLMALAGCSQNLYKTPEYNFAGRPTPPSKLQQRVLVGVTANGFNGALQILDGLRDIRNNVQNTVTTFSIAGYSGGYPNMILSFPEELRGYVYSNVSPYAVTNVNFGTEASVGAAATYPAPAASVAIAPDFVRVYGAVEETGQLFVTDNTPGVAGTYVLNLPNVYKVAVNRGDTVALAMTRSSNAVYRIIKLNQGTTAFPPGAVDCQPTLLPIYCVIPVPGTFDRPVDVTFSLDGSSAYILNCGLECGGGTNGGSGISIIAQGALSIYTLPTVLPYPPVVTSTVAVPGGVTTAILDANNLYLAGQQQQADGLFSGRLSIMPLSTMVAGTPIPISDGYHSKLLFADDNTLWIGSQYCATGERAKLGLNYNCLTRYNLTAQTATIVPANVVPGSTTPGAQVPYPNQDENPYYYGSLTGLCWVQNYHKVYTAYGGQVHAFNTVDGSEIDNEFITVQGSALDVAYIDALTDGAN